MATVTKSTGSLADRHSEVEAAVAITRASRLTLGAIAPISGCQLEICDNWDKKLKISSFTVVTLSGESQESEKETIWLGLANCANGLGIL